MMYATQFSADEQFQPTADDYTEYFAWVDSIETRAEPLPAEFDADPWKAVKDQLNDEAMDREVSEWQAERRAA